MGWVRVDPCITIPLLWHKYEHNQPTWITTPNKSCIRDGSNSKSLSWTPFFFWIYKWDEGLLKGSLSKLHFLILFNLLVESLGIKELMPAYLDPHLQPQDLPTGVSFASGGSGYDPLTSKLAVHEHLCHFLSSVLFYYFKT